MRRMNRLLFLLVVLMVTACLFTGMASAAETETNNFNSYTWVHPMEEDATATPSAGAYVENPVAGDTVPEPAYYCSTIEEYFEAMRQQYAARNTYFVVGFKSSVLYDWNDLNDQISDACYKHTGVPTQGDYLYWNVKRISWSSVRAQDSSGAYYYRTGFTTNYRSTADQEKQVNVAVAALIKQLNVKDYSAYTKARVVYDYMVSNITYDYDGLNRGDEICHTTYSAIVLKDTVCQGYASLFYRLMLEMGVDCRAIGGDANDYGETGPNYPSGVGDNHVWNIVKIDGKWYNLDSTWDANAYEYGYGICHDWFLVSNANFPRHYPWSDSYSSDFWAQYPISTTNYTYKTAPNGWYQRSGRWYFGQGGYDRAGWLNSGGQWFYLDVNGAMTTGWQQVGGKWYYLSGDGVMATGWRQLGGKWYYLGTDGIMATGWRQVSGVWYYFGTDGIMATGWRQISGKWYYFGNGGNMHVGWLQQGSTWYYLKSDGTMATGTITIGGKQNKFDAGGKWLGEVQTQQNGWVQTGGKWYYYKNGLKATGWQQIGGKWYYLAGNGAMQTGWLQQGSTWYYLRSDGTMATGWLQQGSTWYYLKSDGTMATGTITIGGKQNKFDTGGKWLGEVQTQQNGWVQTGGKWYYYKNGQKVTSWQLISGYWYFFNNDGVMRTGWVQYMGEWYYMDADGAMQMYWQTINGKTYYFDHNTGAMWYSIWIRTPDGSIYYACADGYIYKNGWYYVNGGTYYFDIYGVCTNPPPLTFY